MIAARFNPLDIECLVKTAVELWEETDPSDLSERQQDTLDRARARAIAQNWKPWQVRFPLCNRWEPELSKEESKARLMDLSRWHGIEPPLLYELGYEHNNCGGLCVRAGQKQWKLTLKV